MKVARFRVKLREFGILERKAATVPWLKVKKRVAVRERMAQGQGRPRRPLLPLNSFTKREDDVVAKKKNWMML